MVEKIAILDLGTNTFHLKIIETRNHQTYQTIFKTKVFVKLAEDGFGKIGDAPFSRGMDVIKNFKSEIDEFKVDKICGCATEAFRETSNGEHFLNEVKSIFGIDIHLISGDREAELIYYGVRQTQLIGSTPCLIMDIGGGSVEFIIADQDQIFWKQSVPLGGSRLRRDFHKTEPISQKEKETISKFFAKTLEPLFNHLRTYEINCLVGSSGSFDTIVDMIIHEYFAGEIKEDKISFSIDLNLFNKIHQKLLTSTLEERLNTDGLIPLRAEMIVAASMLINFVVQNGGITAMFYSTYSLKEGIAHTILANGEI